MLESLKKIWRKFKAKKEPESEIGRYREELRYGHLLLNISKTEYYPVFKEYLESKIFDYLIQGKMEKVQVLTDLIIDIERQEKIVPIDEAKLRRLEAKVS